MVDTTELPKHIKAAQYPEPLIIPPSQEHRHTLIVLHGRGSSASKFAPEFLAAEITRSGGLVETFPNARFLFPTASKRRAAVYNRSVINQWFDCWSLENPAERAELQIEGLRETTAYIHGLLEEEIALVGARNVALWGLSQGCAAVLVSLLTWGGEPLAAAVGMCGWLPFRERLEETFRDLAVSATNVNDEDPFSRSDEEYKCGVEDSLSPVQYMEDNPGKRAKLWRMKTLTSLSEELDVPVTRPQYPMSFQRTPLFLGHGTEDEKIPFAFGRETARFLQSTMAMEVVQWRQYDGLGHCYSKEMLSDIVLFVQAKSGWTVPKAD